MSQPKQTPCPHCGEYVYVLATTCIHCRGPMRFNPAVEMGSLEAHRIITGWRQPELPSIPPTKNDQRAELAKKIEQLSSTIPVASIAMFQVIGEDGQPEGEINAWPSDFPGPYDKPRRWPIEGVRTLWEQSIQFIPEASLNPDDSDGGFIRWLWSQVQKLWSIRKVDGLAIDPYRMWIREITRDPALPLHPYTMPVSPNPQLATPEEILRVAEHASGLACRSIEAKRNVDSISRKMCESVSDLHQLRTNPPAELTPRDLQLHTWQAESNVSRDTNAYRNAYLAWLSCEQWHRVVRLYELALVKHVASRRPQFNPKNPVEFDYEALTPYLEEVAVELADYANKIATRNCPETQPGFGIPGDKLVTAMDVAQFLGIERTSLQSTGWPDPDERGAGSRPSRWLMGTILPFLKQKYPKKKWTEFNP